MRWGGGSTLAAPPSTCGGALSPGLLLAGSADVFWWLLSGTKCWCSLSTEGGSNLSSLSGPLRRQESVHKSSTRITPSQWGHLLFWDQQRGRNVWTHSTSAISARPPTLSCCTNERCAHTLVHAAARPGPGRQRAGRDSWLQALVWDLRTSSDPPLLSTSLKVSVPNT